jgi:DNA-binding beta-propeller fold protein YncE
MSRHLASSPHFRLPAFALHAVFAFALLSSPCGGEALAQSAHTGFEGRQTHPLELTPDGRLLLAVHSEAAALCVFDVSGAGVPPVKLAEIPVGLEPVSVRARTNQEVWVVNEVSDTVSVVVFDGNAGTVAAVLPTGDEPADVVFAAGKAFVSCARDNEIWIYDEATGALLDQVSLQGLNPSALAASPDGTRVYVAFLHSGNGTTVLHRDAAPNPPAPANPLLPPAPRTALIVPAGDPRIGYTVVDHDVAELDTASHAVMRYVGGIGTNLLGLAVRPGGAELWASHTEARNLIRFEPALNGKFALSRLGVVDLAGGPTVARDLNAGVDLDLLPNPAAQETALSQPTAIVFEADGAHLWTAAFASDRVARVAAGDGTVVDRVDVRTGGTGESDEMRGPRGLALHPVSGRLYVLNKLRESVSVIDTLAAEPGVVSEVRLSAHDPLPPAVKAGRGYLFDARLSGNGLVSCGICHIDADRDGLAWDLGDPAGVLQTVLGANLSVHDTTPRTRVMHPMKGPMTTQTLRGMQGGAPFHWRGDKPSIADFNSTFSNLLGGEEIDADDMEDMTAYLLSLRHHPNPNRNLDRSLPTVFGTGNPVAGRDMFNNHIKSHCVTCHALPTGSDGNIDLPQESGLTQPVKTPPLRTVYQRLFYDPRPGAVSLSGFGLLHDGTGFEMPIGHPYVLDNLNTTQELRDVTAFLLCFDTGTALTVGHTRLAGEWNRADNALLSGIALLEARATAGDCDLVVRGTWQGEARSWLFLKGSQTYRTDRIQQGAVSRSTLLNGLSGLETVAFMGVPVGQGERLGGDADLDGVLNGDDPDLGAYNGAPRIVAEPADAAVAPGATLTLRVETLGGNLSFQWFRNNEEVTGEVSPILQRTGVTGAQAGNYQLRVHNTLGHTTSRVIRVEVYPVPTITIPPVSRTLNQGQSTSFSVTAVGTALSYQWLRGGKPVAGATGRTLSFPGAQGLDAGDYAVVVSNGAGSATSGTVTLTVIEKPVMTAPALPAAIVGQAYLAPLTAAKNPTRFTVSGLPKGLKVPTGRLEISGRALVSGLFPLKIVAHNSAGSSGAPVTTTLEVKPFPPGAVGVYEGGLPRHPVLNSDLGGWVNLNTSKLAGFSGVLRLGAAIHRLRGQWTVSDVEGPRATVTLPRRGLSALTLKLEMDAGNRTLAGTLSDGTEQLDFTGGGAVADPTPYFGNHTLALLISEAKEGDEAVPQGDGAGSFAVNIRGTAGGVLWLPDGSSLRFASPVTEGGWIRVSQPLYRNTGSIHGRLKIVPGGAHRLEGSELSWWKAAQIAKTRVYPGGHNVVDFRVRGGIHQIPAAGTTMPGFDRVSLAFTQGGVPDPATRLNVAELTLPARNPAKAAITLGNPGFVGLTLQPGAGNRFRAGVTGHFSGSFTLLDPDATVAGNLLRKRAATFRGAVVDDGSGPKGYGFFLLPEMPAAGPPATTLRTSLILSGRVRLNPLP